MLCAVGVEILQPSSGLAGLALATLAWNTSRHMLHRQRAQVGHPSQWVLFASLRVLCADGASLLPYVSFFSDVFWLSGFPPMHLQVHKVG